MIRLICGVQKAICPVWLGWVGWVGCGRVTHGGLLFWVHLGAWGDVFDLISSSSLARSDILMRVCMWSWMLLASRSC